MAGQKRALDADTTKRRAKKVKLGEDGSVTKGKAAGKPQHLATSLLSEEVDFPRGGGTTLTPMEVKTIRAEAVKEANEELFAESQKNISGKKRKSDVPQTKSKSDKSRIEHLNYKRLAVGMKLLGQIVSVQPLALLVSLPNQLFGHIPITSISSQYTKALEAAESDESDEGSDADDQDSKLKAQVPDLSQLFKVGQYVRTVVVNVPAPGSTDTFGIGLSRDELAKSCRRVELSIVPELVNAGVQKADLKAGFILHAAVKSREDHGYILDLGLPKVSGFLSFKQAKKGGFEDHNALHVGQLLDVSVLKLSSNGRTCDVSVDQEAIVSASLSEVTNVASLLPGTLVQALVTAVYPEGLNLQVLGFFDATIDQFHLPLERTYKVGQKIKCRILYDLSSTSPPRFAASVLDHILKLQIRRFKSANKSRGMESIVDAFPIGSIHSSARVVRVESERGLVVELQPGVQGFIHISHVSDEHVPSLSPSSGTWKVGTTHRSRVTGYFQFDGLLQLSLRQSVLEQKFLQVGDVQVGATIKGTIKKLSDSGLFVSVSGSLDGVVWPNHYADIALKHPAKRFKPGGSIKCRVLVVNPDRKRIILTAKKSLIDSPLPIITCFDDAKVGMMTHAVVFRVTDKALMVEFYNNMKAAVPAREALEPSGGPLSNAFTVGKVVKVAIVSVDAGAGHIVASIRRTLQTSKQSVPDVSGTEIGETVEGAVQEIHKEHAMLSVRPSNIRGLLSLKNLANHRDISLASLKAGLKIGEVLDELVVVSRNVEKGFVIVANKPKTKTSIGPKAALSMDTVEVGHTVGGRVTRHTRTGAHVKLTTQISGSLHPTDTTDNYEAGVPFPSVDSVLKAVVISIDRPRKTLVLSTRPSRLYPDQDRAVTDREIQNVVDLKVGETVRGFIKSVTEHGLFVTIGRDVDARVQIKELFDDYVKEWKGRFEASQLVKGRILKVDSESKKVEMTFRSGDLDRRSTSGLTLADLREGQKIDGKVKRVEDYGLFIEVDGSKVSGLCHKSELSDNPDANVSLALRSFKAGDAVKAVILTINSEKRQLSFGLKPSYFDDSDAASASQEAPDMDESVTFGVVPEPDGKEVADVVGASGDEASADSDGASSNGEAANEGDGDNAMTVDMNVDVPEGPSNHTPHPPSGAQTHVLNLRTGFQWTGNSNSDEELQASSSEDDDSDIEQPSRKKKRRRREIEVDMTADMHSKAPESNADFERLLLGSPNSSYLWVQFMSFQLQLSEVDKAREVGRRALETINFREEQEKLNVWLALLNLENVYGSDDSLEATFKDAARHNDSKTIHLRLAHILDQTEKHEKAQQQYQRTCKKFGQSSKVWTLFGEHYMRQGNLEESRKLVARSLQSLPKRKHLKTISKFAQLEYKLGDPERGKTIFEGIVDSHPKRWDLWSIYIDMEAGQGDIQHIRNLFDRVLALKMTPHKAKSFFKKWLALERKFDDEEGANTVKVKAAEWAQKAASS